MMAALAAMTAGFAVAAAAAAAAAVADSERQRLVDRVRNRSLLPAAVEAQLLLLTVCSPGHLTSQPQLNTEATRLIGAGESVQMIVSHSDGPECWPSCPVCELFCHACAD
jgi:hypothetical protein